MSHYDEDDEWVITRKPKARNKNKKVVIEVREVEESRMDGRFIGFLIVVAILGLLFGGHC